MLLLLLDDPLSEEELLSEGVPLSLDESGSLYVKAYVENLSVSNVNTCVFSS